MRGKQIAMDSALADLTRKERRELNRIVRRQRKERKRAKA